MLHYADTKEMRAKLRQIIKLRKQQIISVNKIAEVLKDSIRVADDCLKQKKSIEYLNRHNEKVRAFLSEVFK